jgi:soluble lytic murein transglycosylase-like protein
MDPKMNLTIQDYFKNTDVRAKKRPVVKRADASMGRQRRRFGQILATTQARSEQGLSKPGGLTIEAYRSLAVRASSSRAKQNTDVNQSIDCSPGLAATSRDIPLQAEGAQSATRATGNTGNRPASIARVSENLKQIQEKIGRSIEKAAKKYNLAPALLHAMVKTESNYQVRAVSPAGAQGLMQLMPGTARDLGVTNPFDIDQNIDGGAQYIRWMLDRFGGDLDLALAAYNAGPEAVSRHGDQVPPYRETRTYIQRVMRHANQRIG